MTQDMSSFVVRFVREVSDDEQTHWRGLINHVQSNARRNFTRFAEAVQFMQEQTGKEVVGEFKFDPEKLVESARDWEQVTASLSDSMLRLWLQALTSPTRFQQAFAHTLSPWQLPDHDVQLAMVQRLQELDLRLQTMARQVAGLDERLAAARLETLGGKLDGTGKESLGTEHRAVGKVDLVVHGHDVQSDGKDTGAVLDLPGTGGQGRECSGEHAIGADANGDQSSGEASGGTIDQA
jgi:hypothetical protein